MAKSYTIWVPIDSPEGEGIVLDDPAQVDVNGNPGRLKKILGRPGLEITDLPSEEAARELLPKICAALLWAVIGRGPILSFGFEPVPLILKTGDPFLYWDKYPDSPFGKAEVPFDASRTTIYPSNKRVLPNQGTATLSNQAYPEAFLDTFRNALTMEHLQERITDPKIKLSSELYILAHFESSERAAFLTLCTALEVLAPVQRAPDVVREHVRQLISEAQENAGNFPVNSVEHEEFQSLSQRLGNLQSASITNTAKYYVENLLKNDGQAKASELAAEVVRLYRTRSGIVHKGKSIPEDDGHQLSEIVRRALIAEMRK